MNSSGVIEGKRAVVVVVTYNSAPMLASSIDILKDLAGSETFDLVFIDNASTDGTSALLREIEGSTYELNDSNRGFAAAVNQALCGELPHKFFILLNPDASIGVFDLERLIDRLKEDPGLAACTPALVSESGANMGFWARDSNAISMLVDSLTLGLYTRIGPLRRRFGQLTARDLKPGAEPGFISGTVFAGRMEAFRQIGSFDERFFLYYEETDWCRRATAGGWRLGLVPEVEAVHRMFASSPSKEAAYELHYVSRYIFLRKHYGRWVELVVRVADAASGAVLWSAGLLLRRACTARAPAIVIAGRVRALSALRKLSP